MSGLKRLQPGEYSAGIPGKTWNALVDGEERRRASGPPNSRGPQGGDYGDPASPARVLIKNDSGSEVPSGGVLKLTGVAQEPADFPGCEYTGPIFTGETPEADDHDQHIAILTEPVSPGFFGWGIIPNSWWANVNVSDEAHTFAKAKASVDELESDASTGFPIIWKESGTGAGKWAVVSLVKPGGSSLRWGEATTTVSAATGWAAADRGAFMIQFYDDAGATDGSPVAGANLYPTAFDNGSVCCVDTSFTPVRLVSVACNLMPE